MISNWLKTLFSESYETKLIDKEYRTYENYIQQLNDLADRNIHGVGLDNFIKAIKGSKRYGELIKYLSTIKLDYIYKSERHGLNHNERTILFAFYLSEKLKLSDDDFRIIMFAALYHDIGRRNDTIDDEHGLLSANMIDKLKLKLNKEDTNILKTIITCHSLDDFKFEEYFIKNNVQDYDRCKLLFHILKDSDGLDRVRLGNPVVGIDFLRIEESKPLIKASYALKYNYDLIKENELCKLDTSL